jgi:3-keto-disaccharide hydrolase
MLTPSWKKLLTVALIAACVFATVGIPTVGRGASREAASGAPNTLSDKEKQEGWKLLFDGKTTEGWRNYKKDSISDKWEVKDGALALPKGGGGDIITKDQYDSYELLLDWKISPGGNSGVMFHVTEAGGTPWMTGPEIQIQDNVEGHDPQKAGWLYQLYEPPKDPKTGKPIDATKPAGQWNTLRVVLNGNKGEIHMNGVKYAQFELWGDDWNQRIAKSKFAQMPGFGQARKGHIALQDHGDPVAYRNIKIRRIQG